MTKKEVSDLLGKSERTVAQYVTDGLLNVNYVKGATSDRADYDEAEVHQLKAKLEAKGESRNPERLNRETVKVALPTSNVETSLARVQGSTLKSTSNLEAGQGSANFYILSDDQLRQLVPHREKESIADLALMPFLSFPQAARLFNIPEGRLRDAAKAGELKARKEGRGQQVRADDVRAWRSAKFDE